METICELVTVRLFHGSAFSIISPQGDGNKLNKRQINSIKLTFSIISPQGDGNAMRLGSRLNPSRAVTFSIISPQGDGNLFFRLPQQPVKQLFQSFPRKGMETF